MNDNVITISLDDVLGPDGLEGAWDAMVRRLADVAESKFLHSDAGKSFHAAAVAAINDAVQTRLEAKISERMAAPIQPTDSYGNPRGEPTTFDAMIGHAVETALTEMVDCYGKPSRNGAMSLLEYALKNVARNGLSKAVMDEARKVNMDAKKAVSAEIAKAIEKALKA